MNENIKIPKFSEGFYVFGSSEHAYKVPDEEVNKWIEECIEMLEQNKKCNSTAIASGDTKVEVEREDWGGERFIYHITVMKNYYDAIVRDKNDPEEFYCGKYNY
jgi:hypothetical protein